MTNKNEVRAWLEIKRVWYKPWTWRKGFKEQKFGDDFVVSNGLITFHNPPAKKQKGLISYTTNWSEFE